MNTPEFDEKFDPPPALLEGAAKGLFHAVQVIGVTIRKSGSVGIMETHLHLALTPCPTRQEFDAIIQAMCNAGLVRRVSGHGGSSPVLFWIGSNQKKGAV